MTHPSLIKLDPTVKSSLAAKRQQNSIRTLRLDHLFYFFQSSVTVKRGCQHPSVGRLARLKNLMRAYLWSICLKSQFNSFKNLACQAFFDETLALKSSQ